MSVVHVLNVGMTCEGCSGAVTRILGKVPGVQDVECNLDAKTVKVVVFPVVVMAPARLKRFSYAGHV
jgi:copper chaperone CopZ